MTATLPESSAKRNLKQLNLLLWKNSKLQIRSIIGLIIELTVPALFAIILLPIRTIVNADLKSESTEYNSFDINTIKLTNTNKKVIAYQPGDSIFLKEIMQSVGKNLKFELAG